MNSKAKGARGERALAKALRDHGYNCRRGQQYCGANGDADVVGLPGIHIECKVYKANLNGGVYGAIEQARRDAKPEDMLTVMQKKDRCEWLVTMPLEDWIQIYREYEAGEAIGRMDKTTPEGI